MKSLLFILLFCVGFFSGLFAQDRSFGTLPIMNKPAPSLLSGGALEGTPDYQFAEHVYNRLVTARGDHRFPVPDFTMSLAVSKGASMNYGDLTITLEKKAFDVCKSMGPGADTAAVAFLLGHELTHYYEKHAWRRGFVDDYKDLPIGLKLDSLVDKTANETEADYLGGFLAYSAGFGLFDKGDELIGKLYEAYGMGEQMPGYPLMSDRQKISNRTAENLQQLVDVFEMANMLAAIGKYDEAYEYYRYILMRYQSREIYNNLGVTAVLDAIRQFPHPLKFRYPVELDLESSSGKGSDGMLEAHVILLKQALLHFDAAISLDPDYAPAYLNKACAYALLGDTLRARFYANTETRAAVERSKKYAKTGVDVDILLGIMQAEAGDTEGAKKVFETAATRDGSLLGKINLNILNTGEGKVDRQESSNPFPEPETIDGVETSAIKDTLRSHLKETTKIELINKDKKQNFYILKLKGGNSKILVNQNTKTNKVIYFHLTGPGYTGKTGTADLTLGADSKAISDVNAYGDPISTVETPRGQIMVYESMVFILGPGGKLERWVNYSN